MKSQGEERSRNIENEMMMKRDNGEGFKDPRSQVSGCGLQASGCKPRATSSALKFLADYIL